MLNILINADDFGWNETCTEAILKAFQENLITTTTAMANGEAFTIATQEIKKTEFKNRVGIHFDLTEGTPLTDAIGRDPFFCDESGSFHMHIDRFKKLSAERKKLVYYELKAQAEKFKGTGLQFHHADSHHHIHTAPYITPIVIQIMKEYGIKSLRVHRNIGNIPAHKRILKNGYNQSLRRKGIAYSDLFGGYSDLGYINPKSCKGNTLEIMCHPDIDPAGKLIDRSSLAPYEAPFGDDLAEKYAELMRLTN